MLFPWRWWGTWPGGRECGRCRQSSRRLREQGTVLRDRGEARGVHRWYSQVSLAFGGPGRAPPIGVGSVLDFFCVAEGAEGGVC